MIVIDTNVISELMKPSPQPKLISWVDSQNATQLFITTITIAEISYGLSVLPDGTRKRHLEDSFHKALNDAFKHRILSFGETAAPAYGKIMGHRKQLGRPLSMADGQIAAIAAAHNYSIATRNMTDFVDCEVEVINPFA
jgi:predicted nucleic acid-binding protein